MRIVKGCHLISCSWHWDWIAWLVHLPTFSWSLTCSRTCVTLSHCWDHVWTMCGVASWCPLCPGVAPRRFMLLSSRILSPLSILCSGLSWARQQTNARNRIYPRFVQGTTSVLSLCHGNGNWNAAIPAEVLQRLQLCALHPPCMLFFLHLCFFFLFPSCATFSSLCCWCACCILLCLTLVLSVRS